MQDEVYVVNDSEGMLMAVFATKPDALQFIERWAEDGIGGGEEVEVHKLFYGQPPDVDYY